MDENESRNIKLQKYIAMAGVASRRKAGELIKQGKVEVNGKAVLEPWFLVSADDCVKVNGKEIFPENRFVYIMLNKPTGYITTVKDQFSRKSVMDLVKGVKERIYPVGRLDYNTSGLLLLTNDGEFTHKLTHPRHEIEKVYIAEIEGKLDKDEIRQFESGLLIDDYKTAPAKLRVIKPGEKSSVVEVKIHEGRNRQIRKMFDSIGHPVIKLKRVAIGNLTLGNLPESKWRYLDYEEVQNLLNLVKKR